MENKNTYNLKKSSMREDSPLSHTEIYDTEVRCTQCGMPLYVTSEGAALVLTSLRRIGMAGLICLCGHTEFVDAALRPQTPPIQYHQTSQGRP